MLEMGEPVRILDLAERMVRLSGRSVGRDVEVAITGPRPGEKLEEVLRGAREAALPTEHRAIVRALPKSLARPVLDRGLDRLAELTRGRTDDAVSCSLFELVAGRDTPFETAKSDLGAMAAFSSVAPMATLSSAEAPCS